ncbi:MAG: hypothetical protein ACPHRO_08800, partial [Nannocystaceae bacterium]
GDGDIEPNDDEAWFELRLNDTPPPALELAMNRDEVGELFGDTASEILLLELDSTTLLQNTLTEIKNSCGTDWQLDQSNPNHDCGLTALGQSFIGTDGTWQTSAEYSLVRILTMTPANAKVEGTSLEGVQELADLLGLGGGFGQILADGLGIGRTTEFISTAAIVDAIKEDVLASHPAFEGQTMIRFTLEDALTDLASMTARFGPSGGHPGILDPSFPMSGQALGPDFQMSAIATSNMRIADGIDLDVGKDYVNVIFDTTGPTFDDPLEFDFEDPEKFSMTGIIEDLTVDLRFAVEEWTGFVNTCTDHPPCQDNLPASPVTSESVWAKPPWTMEYVVADAARLLYDDRVHFASYVLGAAEVRIGQNGDPPGWVEYFTLLNLGNPPPSQYLWESIMEVAQVALHNPPQVTFPEGAADVAFTLQDMAVGITGPEIEDAVRPYLQAQSSALANYLLGDYTKNNGLVDFYFRRASNGVPYLFFVTDEDLPPGATYTHATPGFFSDPSLSADTKVSKINIEGVEDVTHEKLPLTEGLQVVYVEDAAGLVYRLRINAQGAEDDEIEVYVQPAR